MTGTRVKEWDGSTLLKPGEFALRSNSDGTAHWMCCTPNGLAGNLSFHTVAEHEDGTITVSPSILVTVGRTDKKPGPSWHGFLQRGVWREC